MTRILAITVQRVRVWRILTSDIMSFPHQTMTGRIGMNIMNPTMSQVEVLHILKFHNDFTSNS